MLSFDQFARVVCLWLCVLALSADSAFAQVYPITCTTDANGIHTDERATSVCIANSPGGRSLLITCKHAVGKTGSAVWIDAHGQWNRATRVIMHPTKDLAAIETDATLKTMPLGDMTPIGEPVSVAGFGPLYGNTDDGFQFTGKILDSETLTGTDGTHVMPGDSGGPIVCSTERGPAVVGIISYHDGDTPADSRRTFASRRCKSGFVRVETITQFVTTQYGGCPGGVCPIRVRPAIRQPMFGIGIPIGPPHIVNEVDPTPHYIQQPMPSPSPQVVTGPQGPPGPAGPPGRDGRTVTQEQVEAVVNAWLDSNVDQLRGPAGPTGPTGPAGSDGRDGTSSDPSALASINRRIADLERRPFRIVISSDGKIIDDETYAPGEPVVLDLQRLRKRSDAQ